MPLTVIPSIPVLLVLVPIHVAIMEARVRVGRPLWDFVMEILSSFHLIIKSLDKIF